MPLGVGAIGKAGIIKEGAGYGVGVGAVDQFLEIRAEDSLKNEIEKIPGDYLIGAPTLHRFYHGVQNPKGIIPVVVNPDNIGLLLYMALGVEGNATQVNVVNPEITEITCEADIAGSLSGDHILFDAPALPFYAWFDIDDMGSIDPALVGRTAIPVGMPAGTLVNDVAIALAAAINANANFGAGAVGAVVTITNAANGAVIDATNGDTGWGVAPNVTQQGSGGLAYTHIFTPADAATDLGSFVYHIDRHIENFKYTGCMVNNFSLKATKGSLVFADFDILAKAEDDAAGAFPGGVTPSALNPYVFHMGSMSLGGAVTYVKSFDFTHSWNLDEEGGFVLDGSDTRHHCYKTIETLTGSMELEWTAASDAMRDAFLDNTQVALILTFTSHELIEAGQAYTLTIEIPKINILGDPPVLSSRDRTPFTVNFEASYDATNFIKITHKDAKNVKWSV